MKTSLLISVSANCLLTVALVWLAAKHPTVPEGVVKEPTNSSVQVAEDPERAVTVPPARLPTKPNTAKLTWRSLESTDYRTYVANLRAIACPEQTIRDIITADVHALYARKREELGRGSEAGRSGELARLEIEEQSVIGTLLGAQTSNQLAATGTEATPAARPVRPRRAPLPEPEPSMPVAWRGFDGAGISLNGDEISAINNIRQVFQGEIASGQVDVSDPSYRERWLKAQTMADEMLAAQLGQARFDEIRSQATQSSSSMPDR